MALKTKAMWSMSAPIRRITTREMAIRRPIPIFSEHQNPALFRVDRGTLVDCFMAGHLHDPNLVIP